MNRTRPLLITLFVPLFALAAAASEEPLVPPSISVNGSAAVNISPDRVVLTFGIETYDRDLLAAKAANNEILHRALKAVKDSGIPAKDIQTDYLSLRPAYSNSPGVAWGYSVDNFFVVIVRDAEKVEAIVSNALQAGVNHVHGMEFEANDLKKHREEAQALALRAAREKAEKMASVLGRSLGRALKIVENPPSTDWWRSRYDRRDTAGSNVWQDSAEDQSLQVDGTGEMIALGKISVRGNVTVVFELK